MMGEWKMRDRLIELLTTDVECTKDVHGDCSMCKYKYADDKCAKYLSEIIADYFLANGGIIPPCKVGDTVYTEVYGEIEGFVVLSIELAYTSKGFEGEFVSNNGKYPMLFSFENIGKTVFLSKEDAERALKEREGK